MFNNSSVLITGGTGSFGRKYVETLLQRYSPRRIVVFSRDEQKHFQLEQLFRDPRMRFLVGDVRDRDRVVHAFRGIDFVIHAAAMKHVSLAEYNPTECIATNINGAQNVITAAIANDVKAVMALSTDKAANPVNLYGATKLASDKLFVAANNIVGTQDIKFGVVRYGNVCGSTGSVVPFFENKIAQGDAYLPITDSRMTRFWITLQQGVDFVLKNFERMQGGEIFVPKLPSVKITDLATAMAPHLEQKIIGIRPGEKLHEVMCPADDSHLTLEFQDHYVISPSIRFDGKVRDHRVNLLGETGKYVNEGFEYNSGKNFHFLTAHEIKIFNRLAATNQSFTLKDLQAGKFNKLTDKGLVA
jgi:UDP-N-acetylglucosamine 4,6-dehydratase/5-epimerase